MDKKFIVLCLGFTIILIGGVLFFGSSSNSKPQTLVSSYSISDKEKPKVEAKITTISLGDMKVSDEKSADFKIKNIGTKPLQISNMQSSCGCTVGKLIYEGKESQEFGMHSQSTGVISEILPNKEGIVRVIYRPYVMPVYGYIDREVSLQTNDPQNTNLTFKVTANVK